MASEVNFVLGASSGGLNYLCGQFSWYTCSACFEGYKNRRSGCWCMEERISEISLAASKWPRRSKLSLQVKLVTPIYYMTKFQGIFISQNMTFSYGDDNQGPLTCDAGNKLLGKAKREQWKKDSQDRRDRRKSYGKRLKFWTEENILRCGLDAS